MAGTKIRIKHIDYAIVAHAHTPMYLMHKFWARKPHNVVSEYIKNYSRPGEIVLDPFAGSGVTGIEAIKLGRKAVLIDLDPIATFITRQTALPVDLKIIEETFQQIALACQAQIEALYQTTCTRCMTEARMLAAVWDREEDEPIEIRYFCPTCNTRAAKTPDASDEALLRSIKQQKVSYWYPTAQLAYNHREFKEGTHLRDFDSVDKLFTKRNLIALSILYNEIEKIQDTGIRDLFKFAFTSMVHLASKMCPVAEPSERSHWSALSATSFWAVHRYWIPPRFMESNVWMLFDSAIHGKQGLIEGKEDSVASIKNYREAKTFGDLAKKANIFIKTFSALELSKIIPPDSVDYVFTDPPYGGAVQYFELSVLWSSWLKHKLDWYPDEITINEQQDKGFDTYHRMLHKAFTEIYKVLRPNRYMTVTFHSTSVEVYNSIIQAAVLAGFDLEKIIYQPPARPSAKALLQPYGSAIGDYYIRFKKPRTKKLSLAPKDIDPIRFERVVVGSVKKILVERGEPVPYSIILQGIYVELDRYGFLFATKPKAIERILQKHIGKEFVFLKGAGWWLRNPAKYWLHITPLQGRIEQTVLQVLRREYAVKFDDVLQEIFKHYTNALTPSLLSVKEVLREYAIQRAEGFWQIKDAEQEHPSRQAHSQMIAFLGKIGRWLGFKIHIGEREQSHLDVSEKVRLAEYSDYKQLGVSDLFEVTSKSLKYIRQIDVLWIKGDRVAYAFEVENTTDIIKAFNRCSNIPESHACQKIIVLPERRLQLLSKRVGSQLLKERLSKETWQKLVYKALEDLHRLGSRVDMKRFERALRPLNDAAPRMEGLFE